MNARPHPAGIAGLRVGVVPARPAHQPPRRIVPRLLRLRPHNPLRAPPPSRIPLAPPAQPPPQFAPLPSHVPLLIRTQLLPHAPPRPRAQPLRVPLPFHAPPLLHAQPLHAPPLSQPARLPTRRAPRPHLPARRPLPAPPASPVTALSSSTPTASPAKHPNAIPAVPRRIMGGGPSPAPSPRARSNATAAAATRRHPPAAWCCAICAAPIIPTPTASTCPLSR